MRQKSKLNNSNAYGFSKNVLTPIIMETLNKNFPECVIKSADVVDNKYKPIAISFKENKEDKAKLLSVIIYFGKGIMSLSMYNMMYAKYITFIAEQKCYIVDGDTLRENWQHIMVKNPKSYIDGAGITSEMTIADINKIIDLSYISFEVDDSSIGYLSNKMIEYKIA